jgi:predicted ATP-grasp superfamily ATP-dependent carboligase
MPAALVTDSHERSVVAGIRGLGRAGVDVVAVGPGRVVAGALSRHASAGGLVPSPIGDPTGFAEAVVRMADRHGPVVVYPGTEDSLEALLPVWDRLTLPYPSAERLRALRDKRSLSSAGEVGLATVETYARGRAAQLEGLSLPTPCLVKSATPAGRMAHPHAAATPSDLQRILRTVPPAQELLVQELAPGPLTAVSLVLDRDHRVVARFQQRTVRTWPAAAGPSSLAVGVEPDEELIEQVAELLARQGFWGMAEVQLIGTARGPAPIDVNPRFYGSLPLALASGVNLPAAWHAVATGGPPPAIAPYRTGVVYRWLDADLRAAVRGHRDRLRGLPADRRAGAMWAPDDPLSSLILTAASFRARLARRLPR